MLLFILDFQPFRIVEDEGFKSFVAALNPAYQFPSRSTISKTMIPALYEQCNNEINDIIKTGKSFCITTDCWTSINTVNFMATTAHFLNDDFKLISILLECAATDGEHTSENLSKELQRIVSEREIQNKILLAVSDNAANIKNAISNKLNWKHLGCFAHTLNLIVKDALQNPDIIPIINKVKEIVTHFKKSYVANEKFMTYQKNMGDTPLKLLQDVQTRWNSTFYMLQRFTQLQNAVKSTVALIKKRLPILTHEEWKIIEDLCTILKPFEAATNTISGDRYCTASLMIPIINGLVDVSKTLLKKDFGNIIKTIVSQLLKGLTERLGNVEKSNTLIISTFLDPRFKNLSFHEKNTAENVKKIIISEVAEKYAKVSREKTVESNLSAQAEDPDDELSIWSSFDKSVSVAQPRGTVTSRAIIEVQRYLEDEIIPRTEDPLMWWNKHKYHYPNLSLVAQEKLCALASSVPCERLFSKAGQILNERRNRLNIEKTKMLLFLNTNYKYTNK